MVRPSSTTESTNVSVFVDTNLGTRLCVTFKDNDTVSNMKQKISFDHLICFPRHGKIFVKAIKVERNKCMYHLSSSMSVKNAFDGVKGTWYLHVDVVREKPGDVSKNIKGPVVKASQHVLVVHSLHGPSKEAFVLENLAEKPLVDEHAGSAGLEVKPVEEKEKKTASIRGEKSTGTPPKEKDLKRKLLEASLHAEAKDVADSRKMPSKVSDGETGTGLSNSGAEKDDNTRNVVPVASKAEKALVADPPTLETKKEGKSLPPTCNSKVIATGAPFSCLGKGSDKDCGIGDNCVNMASLKTKQSNSKNDEEPPKEKNNLTSRDFRTSTNENKKKESIPLKKLTRSITRKPAVSDNYSSTCVPKMVKLVKKTCISGQRSQT